MFVARLPTLLLDPRGRMGRTDLLVSATAVLAIEGALALLGPAEAVGSWPVLAAKACSLWIGVAALIKRLHDVGRSGWWALAAAAALCIWTAVLAFGLVIVLGADAFVPGSFGQTAMLALLLLPALGFTLWLHLAPGDPSTNRFGAPSAPAVDTAPRPTQTAGA
jgi:uncharacterized membrane protein YhaH (DUF805 family)